MTRHHDACSHFAILVYLLIDSTYGQINANVRINRQVATPTRLMTGHTPTGGGINLGESFFLNRLREGDVDAFMRLGQFHQTVDTPMSLLHNFFQVFNRPDPRQRTGLFSLLHNLAVARGLLPNSLAIGSDGLPTPNTDNAAQDSVNTDNTLHDRTPNTAQDSVRTVNTLHDRTPNTDNAAQDGVNTGNTLLERTTTDITSNQRANIANFQNIATSTNIISNVRNGQSNVENANNIDRNRGQGIVDIGRNRTIVKVPSNMFNGNNNRRNRGTSSIQINQIQTNMDQRNISTMNGIMREGSQSTVSEDIPLVNNNMRVRNGRINDISNVRQAMQGIPEVTDSLGRMPIGGRFALPSARLGPRNFPQEGSQQRGVQILSRDFMSRIQNETVRNTLRDLIRNRTRISQSQSVIESSSQSNTIHMTRSHSPSGTESNTSTPSKTITRSQSPSGTESNTSTQSKTITRSQSPSGTESNTLPNTIVSIGRPTKLNFLLEMPTGVSLNSLSGNSRRGFRTLAQDNKTNERTNTMTVRQKNDSIATNGNRINVQQMGNAFVTQSNRNTGTIDETKYFSLHRADNASVNLFNNRTILDEPHAVQTHIGKSETKEFTLQRVGHIRLDPTDHIFHLVGEMNLTLSDTNVTIQRVGELNLGRRRQFLMEVTVNASSDADKILLQRVGSTDVVPGERVQLHGSGEVRLLTKERVIIERLGFVRFKTDPLTVDHESTGTDEVRSIFRVEPLDSDTSKSGLLFLGNETNVMLNSNSNETVLQFVGDILTEIPSDFVNISDQKFPDFRRNRPDTDVLINSRRRHATLTRNQTVTPSISDNENQSIRPVLRESIALKSKRKRLSRNKTRSRRIVFNPTGRIYSAVELKFDTVNGK